MLSAGGIRHTAMSVTTWQSDAVSSNDHLMNLYESNLMASGANNIQQLKCRKFQTHGIPCPSRWESYRISLIVLSFSTYCVVLFCRGTFGCRSLRSIRTCPKIKTELGIRSHHGTIRVSANGSTMLHLILKLGLQFFLRQVWLNMYMSETQHVCHYKYIQVCSFSPGTVRTGSKIFFRAQGVHCQVA